MRNTLFAAIGIAATLGGATAMVARAPRTVRTAAAVLDGYFPNVTLRAHDGRRVRFYDDLLKGRTVVVNFMFTSCGAVCPRSTANLRKVQEIVKERLGHDVLMLSISVDPRHDTPEVLARYAASYQVGPGWLFLTGSPDDIAVIRRRLGGDDQDPVGHTGMLVYGNEPAGQWRSRFVTADAGEIATSVLRLADGRFW